MGVTAKSLCLYGKILANLFPFCKSAACLLLRKQRRMLSNLPLAPLAWQLIITCFARLDAGRPRKWFGSINRILCIWPILNGQILLQGCSSRNWVCGQHCCSFDFILKGESNSQVFFSCLLSKGLAMRRGCAPAKYHLKLPPRHTLSHSVSHHSHNFDLEC